MFKRLVAVLVLVAACGDDDPVDVTPDGGSPQIDAGFPNDCAGDRAWLEAHSACGSGGGCTVVGACGNEWGFHAVASAHASEARERSRKTSCKAYDGPIYGAECRESRCVLVQTNQPWCGTPIRDAGF